MSPKDGHHSGRGLVVDNNGSPERDTNSSELRLRQGWTAKGGDSRCYTVLRVVLARAALPSLIWLDTAFQAKSRALYQTALTTTYYAVYIPLTAPAVHKNRNHDAQHAQPSRVSVSSRHFGQGSTMLLNSVEPRVHLVPTRDRRASYWFLVFPGQLQQPSETNETCT